MKKLIAVLLVLSASAPAWAEEHMNLFPKGRAAYLDTYTRNEERYREEGQAFVDDLYLYGGERNMSDDSSLLTSDDLPGLMDADSDLGDALNGTVTLLPADPAAAEEPPASPEQ